MKLSLVEMVKGVRNKDVSPVELVQESIDEINDKDKSLNAFCLLLSDQAIKEAKVMEEEMLRGEFRGPLHGIPFGVKDLFLTKGVRTAKGSRIYKENIPNESSPVVLSTKQAGGIMMGKNTTTEMGWNASSCSPLTGVTRNPWNQNKTAGGSSSGSAVAVASGMVPMALGSDGGGSLRIPASFCGLFSIKPSLGRVPTYPWSATEFLSHAGSLTKTVEDSALMMDVLMGEHDMCHNSLPNDGKSLQDAIIDPHSSSYRIAYVKTAFGVDVNVQIAASIEKCVNKISNYKNVIVEERDVPFDDPLEMFRTFWITGRGVMFRSMVEQLRCDVDPGLAMMVDEAERYTVKDLLEAQRERAQLIIGLNNFFQNYDAIIMPTVPILPFQAEKKGPKWVDENKVLQWPKWTPFTYPFNISGNPAASLPCGLSREGTPIGLQVIGRRFDESTVFKICKMLEGETLFHESHSTPEISRKV